MHRVDGTDNNNPQWRGDRDITDGWCDWYRSSTGVSQIGV